MPALGLHRLGPGEPPLRERKYADPSLCGDLLSIGSDNLRTMFTLDRNGHIGIFFAGIGRIHRVLDGYAMVAVSALSDLIVVPQSSFASLRPLPSRPEQERADLLGAGLYFEGLGEGGPLPYGNGPFQFAIARVLAWSPDGSYALVVGSQGFARGFYLLDTARRRRPGCTAVRRSDVGDPLRDDHVERRRHRRDGGGGVHVDRR